MLRATVHVSLWCLCGGCRCGCVRLAFSDLAVVTSSKVREDGSIAIRIVKFKTRDSKKADVMIIRKEVRQLVQFYIETIRPVFAANYDPSAATKQQKKLEPHKYSRLLPASSPQHYELSPLLGADCELLCVCAVTTSDRALLLTRYGLRFERYGAFTEIVEKLIGKRIGALTWRKIVATESVEKLSAADVDVMRRTDTHDPGTAERHY